MDPVTFAIIMAVIGAAAYADYCKAGGRISWPRFPALARGILV